MSNIQKLNAIKLKLEDIKCDLWDMPIVEKDHNKIKEAMNNLLDELDSVVFIVN